MKLFYSDTFSFPLPQEHRFPLSKYALLRERLLASGSLKPDDLIIPAPVSDEQLLRVHSQEYLARVLEGTLDAREVRRIGLPWSPKLVLRSRHSVGGTIAAAYTALEFGIGFNLAGGTHHAHRDFGSGFCVFNDVAVAARELQVATTVKQVLVLDCDVHQGDGTAAIFSEDPSVFTFSIHSERNFPFRKAKSDLDVGLVDGAGDDEYLTALNEGLQTIFHQEASFDFVFYLAGADPFHRDGFGRLAITKAGLLQRDQRVFDVCLHHRLPVAVVLAGGYAPDISDIVDIHQNTVRAALIFEREWQQKVG
jgi:acetoin utilization deacetylase AcuC-like enzyme